MLMLGLACGRQPRAAPLPTAGCTGLARCARCVWLACRRQPHPLLDLSLLRLPTFALASSAAAVPGGISTMPFLLPLMFQLGFGLSPFIPD